MAAIVPTSDTVEDAESTDGSRPGPRFDSDRLALWVFVAFVVVAAPLVLFHYGAYHWFLRDDFVFLAEREGRVPDLLAPHGGSHLVALPRLTYLVLWQVVGLTSYVPYQAVVVAYHLAAVVMLRVVMRRAGVGAWMATAAAGIMVLFGPGSQNIVWAFQISFTGSLAWGLAHLLLADHDGPIGRRDVLGLLAGLLAVASSGVGVTMVAVVGLAVLLHRGWRAALFHTAPLAALYGAWVLTSDAETGSTLGRPSPRILLSWVLDALEATFLGMAHFRVLAVVMVLVLLAGSALAWGPWRDEGLRATARRQSMPLALFAGSILFAATTGIGRWQFGLDGAGASRYVYLGAALTLPLVAVAAQALAGRWRALGPALVVMFLIPIPFNLSAFEPEAFGPAYMRQREHVLTTAVRMPFARDVPGDVQPIPDVFSSDSVTMSFLLGAAARGDLDRSTGPLDEATTNEFRVRLGVAARPRTGPPSFDCQTVDQRIRLRPEEGDVFHITGPVRIATQEGNSKRASGPWVDFTGQPSANELTIELPDLHLVVQRARKGGSPRLCRA